MDKIKHIALSVFCVNSTVQLLTTSLLCILGNFFVHIRQICYSVTMYVMGPKIFSNIFSPSVIAD